MFVVCLHVRGSTSILPQPDVTSFIVFWSRLFFLDTLTFVFSSLSPLSFVVFDVWYNHNWFLGIKNYVRAGKSLVVEMIIAFGMEPLARKR